MPNTFSTLSFRKDAKEFIKYKNMINSFDRRIISTNDAIHYFFLFIIGNPKKIIQIFNNAHLDLRAN